MVDPPAEATEASPLVGGTEIGIADECVPGYGGGMPGRAGLVRDPLFLCFLKGGTYDRM